uniref:TSC22 domain family protein 3 n=1 Tax=Equus caballus TaxID=9796 RepID=A0A9L0RLG8_HORSE
MRSWIMLNVFSLQSRVWRPKRKGRASCGHSSAHSPTVSSPLPLSPTWPLAAPLYMFPHSSEFLDPLLYTCTVARRLTQTCARTLCMLQISACVSTQTDTSKGGDVVSVKLDNSASGASVVAIDNKIEQAMDLVKNHLMYAVREEVEILKEQIRELVEKNSQLERENTLLKTLASPEQLEKFQSRLSPEEPAPETPQAPEAPGGSAV